MSIPLEIDKVNISKNNHIPQRYIIDTMSFYTKAHNEYIDVINNLNDQNIKLYSNTLRQFSGFEFESNFTIFKSKNPFIFISLECDFNSNEIIKSNTNSTYGYLGLAKSYYYNIIVSYSFGVNNTYSFMQFLISNRIIMQNVFSIYKDKFIIGKSFKEFIPHINSFKTGNLLEKDYIYYFWNIEYNSVMLLNETYKINNSNIVLIDSINKGIKFPLKYLDLFQKVINERLNKKCVGVKKLQCAKDAEVKVFEDFYIILKNNFKLKLNLTKMFYFDEEKDVYFSYIEFYPYNDEITIGKVIFDEYFVEFNAEDGYVHIAELKDVQIDIKVRLFSNVIVYIKILNIFTSVILLLSILNLLITF